MWAVTIYQFDHTVPSEVPLSCHNLEWSKKVLRLPHMLPSVAETSNNSTSVLQLAWGWSSLQRQSYPRMAASLVDYQRKWTVELATCVERRGVGGPLGCVSESAARVPGDDDSCEGGMSLVSTTASSVAVGVSLVGESTGLSLGVGITEEGSSKT